MINNSRKEQMFVAIHTATELFRETCKLKYNRIYSEPRANHYRVKIYQSNFINLSLKRKIRFYKILETVFRKSGFNCIIGIDYTTKCIADIKIKIHDRK